MEQCKVVVLVLSNSFVASEACNDEVEATKCAKKVIVGCRHESRVQLERSWPLLLSNVPFVPETEDCIFDSPLAYKANLDHLVAKIKDSINKPKAPIQGHSGGYTKKVGGFEINFPPKLKQRQRS